MELRQLLFSVLLASTAIQAHALGRLADVRIVDRDSGKNIPVYAYGGQYWVAGTPGARYAIAVHSRSGTRVLAVTSVDGVNVLSGETAAWDQTGYVFSPGSRYQITGWRKSDSEVAAFAFSTAAQSYAGRTGRPQNVGVIGVALFREKVPEPMPYVPQRQLRRDFPADAAREQAGAPAAPAPLSGAANDSNTPSTLSDRGASSLTESERRGAPAASESLAKSGAEAPTPRLGTAHGQRESSWVSHTQFERQQAQPDEIIRIRYDSRENLIAAGVIPAPRVFPVQPFADPFPQSEQARFVPDPPALRY